MTTQQQFGLIGVRVQYESGGQLYQGIILDKVRVLMWTELMILPVHAGAK
jgi:hypothetical protein